MYSLSLTDFELDSKKTRESLIDEIRSQPWNRDWGTVKVEFIDGNENNPPLLRKTMLGDNEVLLERENDWSEAARTRLLSNKKQIAVMINGETTIHTGSEMFAKYITGPHGFYQQGADPIGFAFENFVNEDNGTSFSVSIYELPVGRDINLHEFLRLLIPFHIKETKLPVGGIAMRYEEKIPSVFSDHQQSRFGVAWVSGKNKAIYIHSENIYPDGLVAIFASKYPSSLPSGVSLNTQIWLNDEVTNLLVRLEETALITEPNPIDQYEEIGGP
jgi:hypothetical protein